MKNQPRTRGIIRARHTTRMHEEVMRNLRQIARRENKSFAYVVSEIVYEYFGLEVTKTSVKVKHNLQLVKSSRAVR